jgi:sugar phosphate permease
LTLLVVAGVINFVDRSTLAVANPLIRHDLGLSVADMGFLLSAFLWAYAFAQLPVGALIDRLKPRLLLALGLALWSCAQTLGGLVAGFGQFAGARVLLGLGESPMYPTGARVTRDWFNLRDRGTATGVWNCSSSLGTAISMPLLTFVMLAFGWRAMFVIMGTAGLLVAAAWYGVYRNPDQVALTAEEKAYLTQGDPPGERTSFSFREWRLLFRFRNVWGVFFGFFGETYLTWIYMAWLPGYLEIERHMSIASTGWAAAVPFAVAVVGAVLGGYVVDVLMRLGVTPIKSRQYLAATGLLTGAVLAVGAAYVASNALAVAFIAASNFVLRMSSSGAWGLSPVIVPANCVGSVGSVHNFGGYLGGALAPAVTGLIVQATGSFQSALLVGAAMAAASAGSYLFIIVDKPITTMDMDAISPLRPVTRRA